MLRKDQADGTIGIDTEDYGVGVRVRPILDSNFVTLLDDRVVPLIQPYPSFR
jgi:hypothetical protein